MIGYLILLVSITSINAAIFAWHRTRHDDGPYPLIAGYLHTVVAIVFTILFIARHIK